MLVLRDLPWWLEHPEDLAQVVALAVQYQSAEPDYHGVINWTGEEGRNWYGDEGRAEMVPATTSEIRESGGFPVPNLKDYAEHPELMRFALEIEIAQRRQRSPEPPGPPLRARGVLDNARPPDDHSEDRGHGR